MRGWAFALALALVLATPAQAFAASVFVENSSSAPDLIALLRAELPEDGLVEERGDADLHAHLDDSLELVIADRHGARLLERTLEGGRAAAVRVAALLIAEVCAAWPGEARARPAPAPVEIQREVAEPVIPPAAATAPELERGWYFGAAVGAGFSMWASEPAPQLVWAGSLYAGKGDFEAALSAGLSGVGCVCAVRSPVLRGEPTAFAIVGSGRWSFWRPREQLAASAWVAGGYQRESVEARVLYPLFASDGARETTITNEVIARAGLGMAYWPLDQVRLQLDLGVQVQNQRSIAPPDLMEYRNTEGVERGWIVPWAMLSAGFDFGRSP